MKLRVVLVLVLFATGCTVGRGSVSAPRRPQTATLAAYHGGCPEVLASIKAEAMSEVARFGPATTGRVGSFSSSTAGGAGAGPGATPSVGALAAAPATTAHSTTNDQEAAADEPDLVKTDGRLMVVVRDQPLGIQVVDVSAHQPRLAGFVALPQFEYNPQLLLLGGYAVAIGEQQSDTNGRSTAVTVVSLSDPDHPNVARTFSLDGDVVGARLIAGRVVLVLQARPRVPMEPAAIQNSTISDWLPGAADDCHGVYHTGAPAGLGTVSVVSLDPSSDQVGKGATIVGDALVVYASGTAMYLASLPRPGWRQYPDGGPPETTEIHGFDLSHPARPRYLGSGTVTGMLNGQYAMSEYHGFLRVATTSSRPSPPASGGQPPINQSDNMVTVLQPSGGRLVEVGRLSGLGRGERIYGVRFLGDLGYVVTFRQTDPLYVLDLSDPHHPALRGQLELTGFSSYLHPIGNGLLFAIGQDANLGIQVSVFDVSNPASPTLKSRVNLLPSFSTAESDPHAFLWWSPGRQAVIPLTQPAFVGYVVFKVPSSGLLTEQGRIDQPYFAGGAPQPATRVPAVATTVPVRPNAPIPSMPAGPPGASRTIDRAVVVGDLLYTLSGQEIVVSHLGSLTEAARLVYQ